MSKKANARIKVFPASRIGTFDIGAVSRKKHHVQALIELDVTEARQLIRQLKRQGNRVSFNSWLIHCIAAAVKAYPELHGIKAGRNKILIYDDVDVSIMVEREVGAVKVPLPYVIRQADKKSVFRIREEISDAQSQQIQDEGDYVLGNKNDLRLKLYYYLPGIIRRAIWKRIIKSPSLTKNNMGTVMITSVGMAGQISGWIIPMSIHPLAFAVGSIIKKPGVVGGEIKIREYLHITVVIDHDVIDGAPAARAIARLAKMLESAYGLQ